MDEKMNIQEKTFGYFTQEDWLEIKDYMKEVLKEDIHNIIEEEYIFDVDYIRDETDKNLKQAISEVVREVIKEEDINIREIMRSEVRNMLNAES